jgi:hypothetical protein
VSADNDELARQQQMIEMLAGALHEAHVELRWNKGCVCDIERGIVCDTDRALNAYRQMRKKDSE